MKNHLKMLEGMLKNEKDITIKKEYGVALGEDRDKILDTAIEKLKKMADFDFVVVEFHNMAPDCLNVLTLKDGKYDKFMLSVYMLDNEPTLGNMLKHWIDRRSAKF